MDILMEQVAGWEGFQEYLVRIVVQDAVCLASNGQSAATANSSGRITLGDVLDPNGAGGRESDSALES